jgi:sec-independent protein translocase protein TatB
VFDIGFSELLLIGVIALLVLGPERLPQAARTAGQWAGRLRAIVQRFTADIDRELKAEELRQTLREEARLLAEPVEALRSDAAAARDELTGLSPSKSVLPDRTAASTHSDGT